MVGPHPDEQEQSACPFAPLLKEMAWNQLLFSLVGLTSFQVNVLFQQVLASPPGGDRAQA